MSFMVCFFSPSVLSPTLSAALADQQTNAASVDWALSHTAVSFFHVWPCCLPLWCQILFLRVITLHFTCRTVQMDGRGHACVPMPSAHYLHRPPHLQLKWRLCLVLALQELSHTRHTHIWEYTYTYKNTHQLLAVWASQQHPATVKARQ